MDAETINFTVDNDASADSPGSFVQMACSMGNARVVNTQNEGVRN